MVHTTRCCITPGCRRVAVLIAVWAGATATPAGGTTPAAAQAVVADTAATGESRDRFVTNRSFLQFTRFNRVEGLFVGLTTTTTPTFAPAWAATMQLGYGFSSERVRYQAALRRTLGRDEHAYVEAAFFDQTGTADAYLNRQVENTLGALMGRWDFRDYYARRGGRLHWRQPVSAPLTLGFGVDVARYTPLSNATNVTLLHLGDSRYRANPAVGRGTEAHLAFTATLDFRRSTFFPGNAWYVDLTVDRGFVDFDYSGFALRIKRYQRTHGMQRFVAGVWMRSLSNTLEERLLFDLGGISTLRAYPFKAFPNGNRLFVMHVDYLFGGAILQRIPLYFIPLYRASSLVVFADSGTVRFASPNAHLLRGFTAGRGDLETSLGVGVSIANELVRVNVARRTDAASDPWNLTMRLLRNL